MKVVLAATTISLLAFAIWAQSAQSTLAMDPHARILRGSVLTSQQEPAVRMEFDSAFRYAGGQRFILYDVADAEQHFFVDANAQGRIRRLYWVQFEGFLPNNAQQYRYASKEVVSLGGLDFIVDAQARALADADARPESDGNRARRLIESKGFRLPEQFLWLRLVHLDPGKRKELMIIYTEDLAPTGLSAADLAPGGRGETKWPELRKILLGRASSALRITL